MDEGKQTVPNFPAGGIHKAATSRCLLGGRRELGAHPRVACLFRYRAEPRKCAAGMGRKGSKRRGQRNVVDGNKRRVTDEGGAAPTRETLVAGGAESDGPNDADRSAVMPWMRWQANGLDARREHKELAEWRETSFANEQFEAFYRRQGLLEDEREWPLFLAALRRPLPTTFRLHGVHPAAEVLRAKLRAGDFALGRLPQQYSAQANALRAWKWRGKRLTYLCRRVDSVPQCEAFQIGLDRAGLRQACTKFRAVNELRELLHNAMAAGAAVRQEVVSMLSVLLLAPKPGERVLDMCAAPGSKTTQLLEYARGWSGLDPSTVDEPDRGGLVVANDLDRVLRAPALIQKFSCFAQHELAGLVITTGRGEHLPKPVFASNPAQQRLHAEDGLTIRGYDCVLADVPCSGDGTIRKANDVLRRWSPQAGLELHSIQLAILRRGLDNLRVGGRLCYSTCSFNPVEDEAVVAAALCAAGGGSVQLLNAHDVLASSAAKHEGGGKQLILRPGLTRWEIANQQAFGGTGIRWHSNARVAAQAGMLPLEVTMWPPSSAAIESAGFGNDAAGLHLERCARVLPHDNDTGGFFLALFEKNAEIPGTTERLTTACTPTQLMSTDLVPLDKCEESAKLRASLKQMTVPEEGDNQVLQRRVWASTQGTGEILSCFVLLASYVLRERSKCWQVRLRVRL